MGSDHTFYTGDEVSYLKGLGSHRIEPGNRKELLKKYINSIHLRNKWGNINKTVALRTATDLLSLE